MKKLITKICTVFLAFGTFQYADAQYFYGQDAFKYSQQKVNGTARMQGMGGSYSSLGADATNAFANPAGLGFYNRNEFSISPVFSNNSVSSDYLGNSSSLSTPNTTIGQAALIFNSKGRGNSKKRSGSFAISYNRLIDFNNDFNYSGTNQRSSITDSFAEIANGYGATSAELDAEFDTGLGRALSPAGLYYQLFTIEPLQGGGYEAFELSSPVEQNGRYTEEGSVNQWNLSYGANFNDKTYLGASLGIRTLSYRSLGDHSEVFPNAETLQSLDYFDDLSVEGAGVNLTVGAIIKATPNLQFGINATTPTGMATKETYIEGLSINLLPNTFDTDFPQSETVPNDFDFRITAPLRGSFGTTFFLPKKLGFVSADVEYVGYQSMNVRDLNDDRWSSDQKRLIQDTYKDVLNLKVGGEVRFNNVNLRAGANYLADPYKNSDGIDRSETLFSVGAGYRNSRFFADVAGVFNQFTSSYTPYTVNNPEDFASARLNTNRNNLVISVGAFF
jgi:hypothetical protein